MVLRLSLSEFFLVVSFLTKVIYTGMSKYSVLIIMGDVI